MVFWIKVARETIKIKHGLLVPQVFSLVTDKSNIFKDKNFDCLIMIN